MLLGKFEPKHLDTIRHSARMDSEHRREMYAPYPFWLKAHQVPTSGALARVKEVHLALSLLPSYTGIYGYWLLLNLPTLSYCERAPTPPTYVVVQPALAEQAQGEAP